MAKFNVVQKQKRAAKAERKRILHGDPSTGKLKVKPQPHSISGKRKRKIFKKQRKEEREATGKNLMTMEDVEMAVTEGSSQDTSKAPTKFHMKRNLKLKKLKRKGKKKGKSSKSGGETSGDVMVE